MSIPASIKQVGEAYVDLVFHFCPYPFYKETCEDKKTVFIFKNNIDG
jgi:hypothetical protein